jgi:hypothetical protein
MGCISARIASVVEGISSEVLSQRNVDNFVGSVLFIFVDVEVPGLIITLDVLEEGILDQWNSFL